MAGFEDEKVCDIFSQYHEQRTEKNDDDEKLSGIWKGMKHNISQSKQIAPEM